MNDLIKRVKSIKNSLAYLALLCWFLAVVAMAVGRNMTAIYMFLNGLMAFALEILTTLYAIQEKESTNPPHSAGDEAGIKE